MERKEEKIKQFNVQVPLKLWAALSFWCTFTGRSKREILIEALSMYLEMQGVDKYVPFREEDP